MTPSQIQQFFENIYNIGDTFFDWVGQLISAISNDLLLSIIFSFMVIRVVIRFYDYLKRIF